MTFVMPIARERILQRSFLKAFEVPGSQGPDRWRCYCCYTRCPLPRPE